MAQTRHRRGSFEGDHRTFRSRCDLSPNTKSGAPSMYCSRVFVQAEGIHECRVNAELKDFQNIARRVPAKVEALRFEAYAFALIRKGRDADRIETQEREPKQASVAEPTMQQK